MFLIRGGSFYKYRFQVSPLQDSDSVTLNGAQAVCACACVRLELLVKQRSLVWCQAKGW